MVETYYDVLGVSTDATQDELEAAYRERVFETHPDHSDDPDATEQFQRVATARSVLTDETERARYDRLGHETYVQATQHSAERGATAAHTDSSSANERTRGSRTSQTRRSGPRSASGDARRETGDARSTRDWSFEEVRQQAAREEGWSNARSRTDASTTSSNARSRSRRSQTRTHTTEQTETSAAGSDAEPESNSDSDSDAAFQYAVHDWDDGIELEWDGRSLDQQTVVTIACLWALYPLFVYASLTPVFSPFVNGIVAACTLCLVGYLLTMPRIATAVFGCWSVLVPAGVTTIDAVPLALGSIYGALTLAFVWVPFGYAVVVWWALRP
ncbi:J domain-containing protein [Natrialba asiatica]|uniref:Heat shock protein DnaJ n=1 Tax=Natrialba asiatica (strain ATCC 700177 / DSM 12278 / JCM 9576 / FERM P-10747 / NBRC 102637 / 172P1) TaxID=29540 RepID=M0ASE7_NATA1|nr:DnaJ domain-containing protein [Natrialba asiatica]ELZ01247.1 heat shock protein DnaJ [Natrialba asiatica DSM 12278]